jgi:oligopeptide/dipeptide ABC transporter ATP-binding protein
VTARPTADTGSKAPAVRVSSLRVSYDSRRHPLTAVDDVSFEVGVGETLAIIGESGSGKSTLLRAIAALTPWAGGSVEFGSGGPAGHGVQLVFQDPDLALDPRQPVWKSIAEPLVPRQLRIPKRLRDTAMELLREVGLGGEVADRRPHELSGGQRQRVTIARALAARSALILLDEPVSAQDVSLQASLLRLLSSLQRQHSLTYVVVSHDIAAVARMADRVGVMYAAKLVEIGPAGQVLSEPRHPYTQALIDAVPRIVEQPAAVPQHVIQGEPPDLSNPPSGCRFRTRCAFAIDRCADEVPVLQPSADHDDGHQVSCHRWQEIAALPHPRLTPPMSQAAARSPASEQAIATAPEARADQTASASQDPAGPPRITTGLRPPEQTGANVEY